MIRFSPSELLGFLGAIDDALVRPVDVILIGGSAAAIHYGVGRTTRDIDTWTTVGEELAQAVECARVVTGLAVPFSHSGVADGPYDFESRLERAAVQLRKLIVRVPERHDLVLMKTLRAYEHDVEAIIELHTRAPLDLATLVHRYETEMGAAIIEPGRLRQNFLLVIESVFPDALDAIETRLRPLRPRQKR